MSQQDWDKALNGIPIRMLAVWGDAPDKWTEKVVGLAPNADLNNEWIFQVVLDGETKPRDAAWGQVRPA